MSDYSLIEYYHQLRHKHNLAKDLAQISIIKQLDKLRYDLLKANKSFFHKIFYKKRNISGGIYIYGEVGRGKSMLMDLFFNHINLPKKRIHFHQYMIIIHRSLHNLRKTHPKLTDPLKYLAKEFAQKYQILCFDEFHVNDIADAMILERLFRHLFHYKITIVTTSNRHPKDLYQGGIQREKYIDFVNYINRKMIILELAGNCDYRQRFFNNLQERYIYPFSSENYSKIQDLFHVMTSNSKISSHIFKNMGREIMLKETASSTALIKFDDFCNQNFNNSDYHLIAENFSTIFLTHIPQLSADDSNQLKRFSNLIDILYEHGCNVVFYAACPIEKLYLGSKYKFEFQRIISRIKEMQYESR